MEKFKFFCSKKIIILLSIYVFFAVNAEAQKAKQPNILFIQCDQFRYDCQGKMNDMVKTPNIDKLTTEGMLTHQFLLVAPPDKLF